MRRAVAQTAVMLLVTTLGAASAAQRSNGGRAADHAPPSANKPKPADTTAAKKRRTHHSPNKPFQVGRASWYGKSFHGKPTASGENYDMFQFTAAHRELPLGTWLRVTNLRNGRWVVVRVNDRGPLPPNRIIDLSYGAAQMLELRRLGVERVRLDLVEPTTVAMNLGASD